MSIMDRRERLSPVDTAWLRMDSKANLMMIVGVYEFGGDVDYQRLQHRIERTLLTHPRFRSRVVEDTAGYAWEIDPDFDLDWHVARTALPGHASTKELKQFAARLAGTPLDANRPLWQFHLVDNYAGGNALVVRIHHCIADGISLIGVLMELTSDSPELDKRDEAPSALRRKSSAGASGDWLRPLTDAAVLALDTTGDVAARTLQASAALLDGPDSVSDSAMDAARVATQATRDLASVLLMSDDSVTSLKGMPSGTKRVAWNEPLPLDDVKAVCRALGCSVNDVLLACAAGALRGYLRERGEEVDGVELRAMVPVNLRDPRHWKDLGNKFGLVPLLLPVGVENPIARVYEVQRRMNALKGSYTAVVTMGLLGLFGFTPRWAQKPVLEYLASKATAVMTNVPGPHQSLYLAGGLIRRMMFWVPQSGEIGVGVSILSYAGGVQFSMITDRALCDEPQRIIDRFTPEFEKLALALCMLPWEGVPDANGAESWLFTHVDAPAPMPAGRKAASPRSAARRKARKRAAVPAATPATP